jgi:hypothetical protein
MELLEVVMLFKDCLCRYLTTKKRKAKPTANDNNIRNKFKFEFNSDIMEFVSIFDKSSPLAMAFANAARVKGICPRITPIKIKITPTRYNHQSCSTLNACLIYISLKINYPFC